MGFATANNGIANTRESILRYTREHPGGCFLCNDCEHGEVPPNSLFGMGGGHRPKNKVPPSVKE